MASQPRDSQTLALPDGRTLGFAEFGSPSGYPVLFFHGFPSSRLEAYGLDAPARRQRLRVFALDRPGFGLSSPQPRRRIADWPTDVRAFAHHVGLSRFAVIGGSGGGPYAIACAAALPPKTMSAVGVLAGAPPWDIGRSHMSLSRRAFGFAVRWFPWAVRVVTDGLVGLLRRMARTSYIKNQLDKWLASQVAEKTAKGDEVDDGTTLEERRERMLRILFEGFEQGAGPTVEEARLLSRDWDIDLAGVEYGPLRFWHGADDKNAPIEMVRALAERLPHAELREFPADSHYSVGEHLDEVLSELVPEDERERSKAAA